MKKINRVCLLTLALGGLAGTALADTECFRQSRPFPSVQFGNNTPGCIATFSGVRISPTDQVLGATLSAGTRARVRGLTASGTAIPNCEATDTIIDRRPRVVNCPSSQLARYEGTIFN